MSKRTGAVHREDQKNSVGRLLFVVLAVLLQISWFYLVLVRLVDNYITFSIAFRVFSVLSIFSIIGKRTNASIKMTWVVFIMAMPILGWVLYFLVYGTNFRSTMRRRFELADSMLFPYLDQSHVVLGELLKENKGIGNQFAMLEHSVGFPVYRNTEVIFYKEASLGFEAQLEALRAAKKFIFMEYHAIEDRDSFSEMKEILLQKAKEGVEVRLFYDDVGSVGFINPLFLKELENGGIQCRIFNPIVPIVNLFMNNRDHRKITVVDGQVGFTGGYNLADEYFNIRSPYGYWKDTGIRLRGEAVGSLTMLFLEMWHAMDDSPVRGLYNYLPRHWDYYPGEGYCAPYGDSPIDDMPVGEDVYLNMIESAEDCVYITTPYLIITDEMSRALCNAAKRGVDVRIVLPGIPDKKMVYAISRSYYAQLLRAGVRIYEYSPGFLHSKQVLVDYRLAAVGTINFDYRSLYHHFENGVLIYESPCIFDIADDFYELFRTSREVSRDWDRKRSIFKRSLQGFLRFIAPLL